MCIRITRKEIQFYTADVLTGRINEGKTESGICNYPQIRQVLLSTVYSGENSLICGFFMHEASGRKADSDHRVWYICIQKGARDMGISLNDTPSADRTHIVFLGRMNSGKSSLMNALAGQQISIVSQAGGTTTDLVKKPMEIHGIGPCVLIDTAGFDDTGELGERRIEKAKQAAQQADIAVLVFDITGECVKKKFAAEKQWFHLLKKKDTPVIPVINKTDQEQQDVFEKLADRIKAEFEMEPLPVSALTKEGVEELKMRLVSVAEDISRGEKRFITGDLVNQGDLVLLVMPQDMQAPKGRLILPQVQTLRELLDKKCLTMCVTDSQLDQALAALKQPPALIITDSQVFKKVYEKKPAESRLTSFSVLFAAYKGDIEYFVKGARKIADLTEQDKVLIAECCTHAPLDEDIGRIRLPRLLRRKTGQGLTVDVVSGADFPKDLTGYQLIIQCGACMFNRKHVMSRVNEAKEQKIPMTNYGIAIAYLNGILDKIKW